MKIRWGALAVSFFLSVTLWFSLTGSEKIESQMEIRIDYKGVPANLIIREGRVNKINVRIRASEGQLRSMVGREYSYSLDLSQLQKGENTFPIPIDKLPFHRGIDVIEISPPMVTVFADNLETKIVPVVLSYESKNNKGQRITADITPEKVAISGPSELLDGIRKLSLSLSPDEEFGLGNSRSTRIIPTPAGIIASPPEVVVNVLAKPSLKQVRISRTLELPILLTHNITARPTKVTIVAMVPESIIPQLPENENITATIDMEEYTQGTYIVSVQATLPEGAELVKIEPRTVQVTIQDKKIK